MKLGSKPRSPGPLHALTAAALALPGLAASPAHAQDNAVVVQWGRYQETSRDLFGLSSKYAPLQSDSLQASAWAAFTDRLKGVLNFRQDTWSGATPIATAPREWRGNRSRAADAVSGASPYLVNTGPLFLDRDTYAPLRTDGFGNLVGGTDTQLVHTIAGASRETRRQVDFDLRREWNAAALALNGGVSSEPDYLSRFVGISGQWDLDRKLTTLNASVNYTWSDISATLDHDALPYIYNACGTPSCNFNSSTSRIEEGGGGKVLSGQRHDWAATAGITQVLSPDVQFQANLGFTRSQGYLSNPYKLVAIAFIDPEQQFLAPSPEVMYANAGSILEKRPDLRQQWLWNFRYAQYVEPADAGLHVNYAYFHDDWGIRAHTFEVEWAQPFGAGWMFTPMVRYYTQTAAAFYTPYLVTEQGPYTTTASGMLAPFDLSKLPPYYSSDYRLSAFGTLGGGLTLTRTFAKGVTASLGYVYFQHSGNLKWGGGGEGSFADFGWWLVNASVKFDVDQAGVSPPAGVHAGHHHDDESGGTVPAGVLFGHMLPAAGDMMAGLRFAAMRQAGGFRQGTRPVGNATVKEDACGASGCVLAPSWMDTTMYMLELMYAPTGFLTLMLMPTYMNMGMQSTGLVTMPDLAPLPPDVQALFAHHTSHQHTSGGIGDTGIYALLRMLDSEDLHAHVALGVTAPTGSVSIKLRDTHQIDAGFDHYGMQLGSGTWDFNPSATCTGSAGPWFWGAQASVVVRMQRRNASGYALGNVGQATAWGGYASDSGVSATLRGVYTRQQSIRGEFNGTYHKLSPIDYPANYGGRFWDLGMGIGYAFKGAWTGNQINIEWLQPIRDDFNGYQLERRGTLQATWQYDF